MRLVNYIVKKDDGRYFTTTHYTEAVAAGNVVAKTYLTEIDETTDAQLKDFRIHREKLAEKRAERGI